MIKLLSRLLLVAMAVAFVASCYGTHFGTTMSINGHETDYFQKWPWLHQTRQIAFYGILVWSVIFAKSETIWVRVGLIALILGFAIIELPPKVVDHLRIPEKV